MTKAPSPPAEIVIVGAGAAGLMAGRELARAGRKVTILEARERCGGRIWALPAAEFGYPAEGGAEFVHGAAPVTLEVLRAAGLAPVETAGARWSARGGALARDESELPDGDLLYRALAELATDMPIAAFLATRFPGPRFAALRHTIARMVEGYDAADPARASTFALRDEWMEEGISSQGRVAQGYGALIEFLAEDCRRQGAAIRLGAEVAEIAEAKHGVEARMRDGSALAAEAAILAVPPPVLAAIALPAAARSRARATAEIGFGNVVKILLRFDSAWWTRHGGRDLADLSFLVSEARVPTWWTQHPAPHPVLTGWYAGPKADTVAQLSEDELIGMGLDSLAAVFALPRERLAARLAAARAIDWGRDPFARGAYSYATPATRAAQAELRRPAGRVHFSGEALYPGRDMGTVEAALASGRDTARAILAG